MGDLSRKFGTLTNIGVLVQQLFVSLPTSISDLYTFTIRYNCSYCRVQQAEVNI